ncbi:hypothetical protein EYF80_011552 [Liparis tanakae]|uniref:Uncharacterized protein n=1 Tax=Liparis tanakae TaxID=230148 RepID=A0A4Z2IM90_9TELE|nr:hypothetical protein EYF80_011552 [Liparis tanakae]
MKCSYCLVAVAPRDRSWARTHESGSGSAFIVSSVQIHAGYRLLPAASVPDPSACLHLFSLKHTEATCRVTRHGKYSSHETFTNGISTALSDLGAGSSEKWGHMADGKKNVFIKRFEMGTPVGNLGGDSEELSSSITLVRGSNRKSLFPNGSMSGAVVSPPKDFGVQLIIGVFVLLEVAVPRHA